MLTVYAWWVLNPRQKSSPPPTNTQSKEIFNPKHGLDIAGHAMCSLRDVARGPAGRAHGQRGDQNVTRRQIFREPFRRLAKCVPSRCHDMLGSMRRALVGRVGIESPENLHNLPPPPPPLYCCGRKWKKRRNITLLLFPPHRGKQEQQTSDSLIITWQERIKSGRGNQK